MKPNPYSRPSLLLALILALSACEPAEPPREPLLTLEGQLTTFTSESFQVHLALAWYARSFKVPAGRSIPSQPWVIHSEKTLYQRDFPLDYRFPVYSPPPDDALVPLGDGFEGKGAVGILLAFQDLNRNGQLDIIPTTGEPIDRVFSSSLLWGTPPGYMLVYLDSEPKPETGMNRGFNLLKVTEDGTPTPVPPSTPIPLALSKARLLDALVCAGSWNDEHPPVANLCGLNASSIKPGPDGLLLEGLLDERYEEGLGFFTVFQNGWLVLGDATVLVKGAPIPYSENNRQYAFTHPSLLYGQEPLEIRVIRGGQEMRRTVTLPEPVIVTDPTPNTVVKNGAPLEVRWNTSAGARNYRLSVGQETVRVPATENAYTFSAVRSGPDHLWMTAENHAQDGLGPLRLETTRHRPITFEP